MASLGNMKAGLAVILLILVAAGVWLFTRQGEVAAEKSTLERLQAAKTIRIGYANEEPYGYLDTSSNRVTGEAPEIATRILNKMGIGKIEPVVTEFGSLIPGLKAGRFDLIAAGMYITPERCKEVSFTNPTYRIGESFIVKKGNPLDLHSFEDVAKHETARIGVMGGAQEHHHARGVGIPEERIVIFPDYPSALAGLKTDRVDCVAATYLTVGTLLRKEESGGAFERADPFTQPVIDGKSVEGGYGAFAVRKEDRALLEALNKELAAFIGTPEHLELVKPFGFSEDTLPGTMSAEEICGEPQSGGP